MGFVKAPTVAVAADVKRVYSQTGGNHLQILKNDPTALVLYSGTLTRWT
jgi:hypothetical protein